MGRATLACSLACLLGSAAAAPAGLQEALQAIADRESANYKCAFSIAYRDAHGKVAVAAGSTDGGATPTRVDDGFAFGSITKVLTGSSILRLVSEGHFSLQSSIAPLVDPLLADMAKRNPQQGFSSLADLWGSENITDLTVYDLLNMKSGIPDFDTALPCFPGKFWCLATDPLRQALYADPAHGSSPTRLLSMDWVKNHYAKCKSPIPFFSSPFCYSSTNFMILGMILFAHQASSGYDAFPSMDRAEFLPAYLKDSIKFGIVGGPSNYTSVHGFDRTTYNEVRGEKSDHDNWNVSGVFSGWTASDVVASTGTVADLTWEVYGPEGTVAPKEFIQQMIPKDRDFYGLATMNLNRMTGHSSEKDQIYGKAYGHLGATYGYQSVTVYFPGPEFVLTVATNIELDYQEQTGDAICFAYNAALGLLLNRTINCTHHSRGYYGFGCKCDNIDPTSDILVV